MQVISGIVVTMPRDKTVVVEVTRRIPHPLYRKLLKQSKRYKVAVEKDVAVGDRVRIIKVKPLSKDKHFKVLEVMK